MRADGLSEALCQRLSALIAQNIGLHFPPERYTELQRGIAAAAEELGYQHVPHYADWLLATPLSRQQLHALASHLTIGETYFFRERKTFDALAQRVLPELLHRRRGHQRLRLWSAACCTGEEPYSLAILVQQLLGETDEWDVTILATDINERFLQRAAAGVYGEWSFRGAPSGLKEQYFTRGSDGSFTIVPEIRRRVRFAHRNLALDAVPADLHAVDLILCRNVLMYFTPSHAHGLVDKLHDSLAEDGWLAVAPCECSQRMFARFETINLPDVVLYRKQLVKDATPGPWITQPPLDPPPPPLPAAPTTTTPDELAATARTFANQGQFLDALEWSERWIATDKVDAVAHYLHAIVLQELGRLEAARRSLQRVVYLRPQFALAHFALGNLARGGERPAEANRHFANALYALQGQPPEELLPESDGMTVEQLVGIITTLLALPDRSPRARETSPND